jgi:subtilisin family serine protease
MGVYTIEHFQKIGVQHVKLPKGMSVEEALEIYRSDPDVEYVEPNYYRYATATTPVDTFFTRLWGLNNTGQNVNGTTGTVEADIDAIEAWDITTGSNNVVVAVIDSGVDYNHPDLAANIWINVAEQTGTQGVDDDGNGKVDDIRGWDFLDDDSNPMDNDDHGTHVAGTIAAEGDNNTGITGVTWTAKIMVLRFLDGFGLGSVAGEIEAIDYAIDKGANIINASYGSNFFSNAEMDAIDGARQAGILFVAAAGNGGSNNDSIPHYPSSYNLDNIIAVAASDQNDNLAPFTDFGFTSVDVAAPGTNTYSSKPPDRSVSVFSDDFESGTGNWSMDSPWGLSGTDNIFFSPSNSLTDSPGGNYGDNIDVSARINNALDLSGRARTRLTFKLRGESERGPDPTNPRDPLYVETATNAGGPWTNRNVIIGTSQTFENGISGTSSGQWVNATVELDNLDGRNDAYFRFRFQTDANTTIDDGWYIDDVTISTADTTYPDPEDQYYQYFQGTSMATPHVSGLAALLLADDPGSSPIQVIERILNGVEVKSGLAGMLVTSGRINAYYSIRNVPAPPSSLSAAAASSSGINVTWSDSSYGEDGFKIERKTDVGGLYAQVAATAANTTTYSDTGLDKSTTYYYRVRSFNGSNNSDFSAEASATTTSSDGGGGGGGGSCFIATAAFGSPLNGHVAVLQDFRARFLFPSPGGRMFVRLYNQWSPPVADFIREHEAAKIVTRLMLYPFVGLGYIALHTLFAQQISLARIFHELLAATADMAVLPGVLGCRHLRRTIQVRLGPNPMRLPGGTPIFTVSRQQFMKYPGLALLATLWFVTFRRKCRR